MEAHTLSGLVDGNRVTLLLNGDEIFPAMLAAIRQARTTITFANYIYEDGAITETMAAALAERCRAGVGVNILLDAVGSSKMPKAQRALLRQSGCHLAFYHSLSPLAIKRVNHRNHRRILVVDGRVGFTGGTGVGEKWTGDGRRAGHWRQTDVQVEGPIVRFLQAAFAENWRDTHGPAARGRRLLSAARAAREPGRAIGEELAGERGRRGLRAVPARHRLRAVVDLLDESLLRSRRRHDRRRSSAPLTAASTCRSSRPARWAACSIVSCGRRARRTSAVPSRPA